MRNTTAERKTSEINNDTEILMIRITVYLRKKNVLCLFAKQFSCQFQIPNIYGTKHNCCAMHELGHELLPAAQKGTVDI